MCRSLLIRSTAVSAGSSAISATAPRSPKQVSEQARGGFLWQDFYLGGAAIEFIEELPGHHDFITTFLKRRGEGFHHLSFEVDRLDPLMTALKHQGVRIAGFRMEFIQSPGPGTPDDFVARFIERRGQGMHHFTVDVKDFDGTLDRLNRDGVRIVGKEINWRGERQFFISPRSAFGTLIQVWDGLAGPAPGSE
jgi:Glyoxalase/Bleomycin resistance protein/Dioxygenase superfamily